MSGRLIRSAIVLCLLSLVSVAGAQGKNNGADLIQPVLRKLLSKDHNISDRHRAILKSVIDKYLPPCPAATFHFDKIQDALTIEDQGDGSFRVITKITCDKSKDTAQMRYVGQYMVLNADGSIRARNDIFHLSEALDTHGSDANASDSSARSGGSTGGASRQEQITYLRTLLKHDHSLKGVEKAIFRTIITNYFPTCRDYDYRSKSSANQVLWLRKSNGGYVAVLLAACDWKDAQAFYLDSKGKVIDEFRLPLGKYGFGPQHEFRLEDVTGDGQDEFLYQRVFPTSSVPDFYRELYVYKFYPRTNKVVKIFSTETEEQDCSAISLDSDGHGLRRLELVDYEPSKGLIKIKKQTERMNCDDFAWGEKPVRITGVRSTGGEIYRWSPPRFRYIRVKVPAE